ncbi:unnamed protein product [Choristocarpus tenellus]
MGGEGREDFLLLAASVPLSSLPVSPEGVGPGVRREGDGEVPSARFSLHHLRVAVNGTSWVSGDGGVQVMASFPLESGPIVAPQAFPPKASLVPDAEVIASNALDPTLLGTSPDRPMKVHILWPEPPGGVGGVNRAVGGASPSAVVVTVMLTLEGFSDGSGGGAREDGWETIAPAAVVCDESDLTLTRRVLSGCIGGGGARRGSPGLLLLTRHGQAAWVAHTAFHARQQGLGERGRGDTAFPTASANAFRGQGLSWNYDTSRSSRGITNGGGNIWGENSTLPGGSLAEDVEEWRIVLEEVWEIQCSVV